MSDKQIFVLGLGTYMRPKMVEQTLVSFTKILLPENSKVIMVFVDNDENQSAKPTFEKLELSFPFQVKYVVEPERGIVHMRNRVLTEALELGADYISYVDDDEEVSPEWLVRMWETLVKYDADAVAGAVERILPEDTPEWLVKGGFYNWERHKTGAKKIDASTANILFKASLAKDLGLRFHPALNLVGSSDKFFFRQATRKGATIVWLDDILVKEYFPASRVNKEWMVQRAFRRTFSRFARRKLEMGYPLAAVIYFINGILLLLSGIICYAFTWPFGPIPRLHSQRLFVKGLGTFYGIFGGTYEEYKKTHGY
ncbi:MAG: hypothetical protein CMP48_15005 [Rickettsiales bacterium]|nr:hypothetical protein [Rickettsiales bacterium]